MYKEKFPEGTKVRIAERVKLEEFLRTWEYHHKLEPNQLTYAGNIAEVESVKFYHGGDVLCELRGIPGIWHEELLDTIE